MAKAIGLGVLTMGMYTEVPNKANSSMYIAIVDRHTSSITYFKRSFLPDKEPLNEKIIHKHLKGLFRKYFD